jgi:hypothetical protein
VKYSLDKVKCQAIFNIEKNRFSKENRGENLKVRFPGCYVMRWLKAKNEKDTKQT